MMYRPVGEAVEAWQWLGQPQAEWPDWVQEFKPDALYLSQSALLRLNKKFSWIAQGRWLIRDKDDYHP